MGWVFRGNLQFPGHANLSERRPFVTFTFLWIGIPHHDICIPLGWKIRVMWSIIKTHERVVLFSFPCVNAIHVHLWWLNWRVGVFLCELFNHHRESFLYTRRLIYANSYENLSRVLIAFYLNIYIPLGTCLSPSFANISISKPSEYYVLEQKWEAWALCGCFFKSFLNENSFSEVSEV